MRIPLFQVPSLPNPHPLAVVFVFFCSLFFQPSPLTEEAPIFTGARVFRLVFNPLGEARNVVVFRGANVKTASCKRARLTSVARKMSPFRKKGKADARKPSFKVKLMSMPWNLSECS